MSSCIRSNRRTNVLLSVVAVAALLFGTVAIATPAAADTAPANPTESASVSDDALPTVQIDGVVWAEVIIGNTVYAGGQFTTARPAGSAPGVNTVARSNLLSYNLTTGQLITTFAPTVNGVVKALATSPDGSRLYVGGLFTQINGANRYRIAAIDVASGTLVSNFAPAPNYRIAAIVATNTTVYFGGSFSAVGSNARGNLAAVSASNGAILPWAPSSSGAVSSLALSPDGTKVAVGGVFTSLNGSANPGYGLGMVPSTGTATTVLPFAINSLVGDGGPNAGIESLVSDGDSLYGSGYVFGSGGNLEGSFRANWSDGSLVWIEDCHGDTYSVYPGNNLEYIAGHPHMCNNIGGFPEVNPRVNRHATAFTKSVDGVIKKNTTAGYYNFGGIPKPDQVNWFPDINAGTFTGQNQGTWFVTGNAQYVVYGGEFTAVNGVKQQGLVRFAVSGLAPNKMGPQLSGTAFPITGTSTTAGVVSLSWPANYDYDNEVLTYKIIRNGVTASPAGSVTAVSRFYQIPTVRYTDSGLTPGQTYSYSVQAVDPFGNTAISAPISVVVKGGTPVNTPPTASFTSTVSGATLSVDGSASLDPDGSIASYAWSFGDGGQTTGATASHTYVTGGTYSVTLTVTDNANATGTNTQTIVIAPIAPPPTTAADAFGRTVASGWGSADSGGSWTVSGAASSYAVDGGAGTITIPKAGQYLTGKLSSFSSTSTDSVVTASLGTAVIGSSAYIGLLGRTIGAADYEARVVVDPTNSIVIQTRSNATTFAAVKTAYAYTTGEQLQIRLRVTGTSPTTLQAKIWPTGTTEPSAWNLTSTDSTAGLQAAGGVGLGLYIGGGVTALPFTVSFDNLSVSAG